MSKRAYHAVWIAAAFVAMALPGASQEVAMSEIKFNSGQTVQPAYEGWTRNADGSRSMWFGYMNRNWEETPDIPAGPANGFGAAGEDLGQPTHFLPRREAFVFKVDVPADWPVDKDLVWTVTANGTTLKAFGSLWPVWEIDQQTMSANNGGRTARTFGEPVNLTPTIPVETAAAVCGGSSAAYAGTRRERRRVAVAGNSRARNRRAPGAHISAGCAAAGSPCRGRAWSIPGEVGSVSRCGQVEDHAG